jgi:hypothetical protein
MQGGAFRCRLLVIIGAAAFLSGCSLRARRGAQ